MNNSLVVVYGFEDETLHFDDTNIICCDSINHSNKNIYCNIIIQEKQVKDILQIIRIFKKNFYFKINEMDKFAFSQNKKAKWQLAIISKKKLKFIMFDKNFIKKKVLYNIDYAKNLIYM